MFWVCSLKCLLSTTIPESQDSVLGLFSKIMWCAKAVLGVPCLAIVFQERPEPSICTTASDGRSDGEVESEALQLKLLRQQMYSKTWSALWRFWRYANYLLSSWRAIWKIVWMEGPLHSQILRLELSACFLFVDCSSWPNVTAACAAQVAKRGVLSSFRHGYIFWRRSFRNRGLVTILVHLYLYNLIGITTLPEWQDSCFVFVSVFNDKWHGVSLYRSVVYSFWICAMPQPSQMRAGIS